MSSYTACIALTIGCDPTTTLCYLTYPEALYDPSGYVHHWNTLSKPLIKLFSVHITHLNEQCALPGPGVALEREEGAEGLPRMEKAGPDWAPARKSEEE
jgi:hypothetical protein